MWLVICFHMPYYCNKVLTILKIFILYGMYIKKVYTFKKSAKHNHDHFAFKNMIETLLDFMKIYIL